ncbi:MAG: DUF4129 domain-containing protein [Alcanivoracaceae bacterium]|jgi:hypothetical protein|nr:DUF4129 domain-containing protein [Alcanivoracaceae bacterium]
MQIERTSARIAPRSAWQAMDMGTRLYQHWWRPLTGIWLATTLLPALLLLAAGMYWHSPGWAAFLFWWLKPVWEAPLLEYIARALFDPATRIRDVLWRLPALLRSTLPFLLLRRLDPSRAFHLPVSQLEGQRGDGFSKRARTLALGESNHAGTCTVLMLHVEQVAAYALLILGFMLLPNQLGVEDIQWFGAAEEQLGTSFLVAWYLAMLVCEPLYVCMSFALYLNKRTWLEGWDLELGLRRIGEKRRLGQGRSSWLALLLTASLAVSALAPAPASASVSADAREQQQEAIELVADERFMPMEEVERWRFKGNDGSDASDGDSNWLAKILKWLFSIEPEPGQEASASWLPDLASLLRVLLWAAVISLVIWLVYRYRHWILSLKLPARATKPARPMSLAGLDIARHTLPDDISAAALAALHAGDRREALSLLYRGTLSRLVEQVDVPVGPGDTEQECLRAFRRVAGTHRGVALLAELTPAWISTAWAHRPPAQQQVEALAHSWRTVFGQGAEVSHA